MQPSRWSGVYAETNNRDRVTISLSVSTARIEFVTCYLPSYIYAWMLHEARSMLTFYDSGGVFLTLIVLSRESDTTHDGAFADKIMYIFYNLIYSPIRLANASVHFV